MFCRSTLPTFLLFAIILFGGCGIARLIFIPHDLIGLSAIIGALALVATYRALAMSKLPFVRTAMDNLPSKSQRRLASVASDSFPVFPGRPKGYAGYTDYNAMKALVNDDLVTRSPAQQYWLLGFGCGFLEEIRDFLAGMRGSWPAKFSVANASVANKEAIGWLAYLQRFGTDNADQSTENLCLVIGVVSGEVRASGPIAISFADKLNGSENASLAGSGISDEMIKEFIKISDFACLEGRQQARDAVAVFPNL